MADVINTTPGANVTGTSGGDMLYGTGGNNAYYGSTGNDSFVLSLSALQASAANGGTSYGGTIAADAAILDFGGAGGWAASNNDFIALIGFSAGSTFTFDHYGTAGNTTQFYTIHDAASGQNFEIYVHSTDGKLLSKATGDVNFY